MQSTTLRLCSALKHLLQRHRFSSSSQLLHVWLQWNISIICSLRHMYYWICNRQRRNVISLKSRINYFQGVIPGTLRDFPADETCHSAEPRDDLILPESRRQHAATSLEYGVDLPCLFSQLKVTQGFTQQLSDESTSRRSDDLVSRSGAASTANKQLCGCCG